METNVNLMTELYDIKRQNIDWEIKLGNDLNFNQNIHLFNNSFAQKVDDLSKINPKFKITLSSEQKSNNNLNTNELFGENQSLINTTTNRLLNPGFNQMSDGIKNVEQYVERRKINGITWYYCKWTDCDYGSNKSNHLVRHVRTHTGEKPYSCDWPNCDKKFTDSWKRKDHILSHNRKLMSLNTTNPSMIDNRNENNLKLFVEMLNNTNTNIGEPIDTEIGLKADSNQELNESNREEVLNNNLSLLIPEVIVNEMDTSLDNILNNDNNVTTDESNSGVEQYIERTLKSDKVWYRCKWNQCLYGSADKQQLIRHIRSVHQKERNFLCEWPDCAKLFSDAYKLKEHQLTHYRKVITAVGTNNTNSMNLLVFDSNNKSDDKIDNSIIISECNNSVQNMNELSVDTNNPFNRMSFNLSAEQMAQSMSPKKAVMSIKNVEQYVDRRKVDGMTRYFCKWSHCSYSSNKSNHLVRHISSHLNERSYVCDSIGCNKRFTDVWTLRDHQLSHNSIVSSVPNSSSEPENSLALVPVVTEDKSPKNYTNYTPNRLLIQSLCSPLPLLPTLPLPIDYHKMPVRPKNPVDIVMSIKNVEQYVERRKVNGITFYYCKWKDCSYGSNKSNHLVRHVRSHTGERPYGCDECDKKFTDSWKLKDHKSIHAKRQLEKSMNEQRLALINYYHNNNQNNLEISLNQRQIDFEEENANNFNLKAIDFIEHKSNFDDFSEHSVNQMDDNSNEVPEMDLLVPQVIIDESEDTVVNLNNGSDEPKVNNSNQTTSDSVPGILSIKNVEHYVEKVVKSDGQSWYNCKYAGIGCGFSTQKSSYIVQHIYKHTGEKPYKCNWSDCNEKFNKKQNLTIHMLTHTGSVPFRCHYPSCYYQAITSEALQLHFQKHEGEKPFRCGWEGGNCSAQFATGIELLRHTKTHTNTGVRMHRCHFPNCPYISKYRNKLTIHLRRHTNDRPFRCEFENCGKSFIVKDKLKRHETSVHHKVQFKQQSAAQQLNISLD